MCHDRCHNKEMIGLDRIRIKDLKIYGYHGVNAQEKEMGQIFLVSADIFFDARNAGLSDSLDFTVSYAQLCMDIEKEFNKKKYNLIETAAEKIAEMILEKYDLVEKTVIEIKKPWAPIGKSLDYASIKIERGWHVAYIAVGSNLGDRESNIMKAIDVVENSYGCFVTKVSELYETKPVGFVDQNDFLNGAIEVRTMLTPNELLKRMHTIENEFKRDRTIKWGPRTIDLDIIFYDNLVTWDQDIVLPHPLMHERMFVLKPLCDIAPYYVHPLLNKRVSELCKELEESE